MAAASAAGVVGRDEQPGDPVLDHLGDPADVRRHDRPGEGHRLEDRQAEGLAVGRQDRDVERGGHRRDVVAAAGEDDPIGRCRARRPAPRAPRAGSPRRRRAGCASGTAASDRRPRLEQRRVALLRLEPGDDPDDRALGRQAVLLAQRAARLLVVVALEVDPVVDERDRAPCRDPRAASLSTIDRETAISRSIRGVRTAELARDPRRSGPGLEWTVETTYGRGRPISPRAIAARVPTSSARYMWLWTTSGRRSPRRAATAPVAIASSGSSMTVTGIPCRSSLRTALPGESETTWTS